MHREIGPAVEQGRFEFLDEQPLAAHFGKRAVKDLIASGRHLEQAHLARGIQGLQPRLHVLGLPEGEPACAGCDHQLGRFRHAYPARYLNSSVSSMPMTASMPSPCSSDSPESGLSGSDDLNRLIQFALFGCAPGSDPLAQAHHKYCTDDFGRNLDRGVDFADLVDYE